MVLGGYIAAAYRINYVLDFAVFGPPLIVAAAVTASAARLRILHRSITDRCRSRETG